MKKSPLVPLSVSAGLDSIGVRMPNHKITLELIKRCGFPLAAPSANISGYPSPTTAQHVLDDFNGDIAAVLDGGVCTVGMESTVIMLEDDGFVLLRTGEILIEEIEECIKKKSINKSLNQKIPRSPGVKYKHYSPQAEVVLVESMEKAKILLNSRKLTAVLVENPENQNVNCEFVEDLNAQQYYSSLRKFDKKGIQRIIVILPTKNRNNLHLLDRIYKSAGISYDGAV